MKKIFIDTNILLDVILHRADFYKQAAAIWADCESRKVQGYVSAISLNNMHYIMRKMVQMSLWNTCASFSTYSPLSLWTNPSCVLPSIYHRRISKMQSRRFQRFKSKPTVLSHETNRIFPTITCRLSHLSNMQTFSNDISIKLCNCKGGSRPYQKPHQLCAYQP